MDKATLERMSEKRPHQVMYKYGRACDQGYLLIGNNSRRGPARIQGDELVRFKAVRISDHFFCELIMTRAGLGTTMTTSHFG